MTFLEGRLDRAAPATLWRAVSAWLVIGVLVLANLVGLVLDRAAMLAP
ncbi:MAG: hypothetical protein JO010_04445 [Alphaproteobacteria bacterium]|nr:hypothetical protein [Alphaproteobacteria bacterium]